MKISQFSTNSSGRPAAKFVEIGDRAEGTIVEPPQLQPDKYSDGQVLVVPLDTETVWARRQMLDVIADAVKRVGQDEIQVGGWLAVEYVADKATSGRYPMKVYSADYTPPGD